MSEAQYDVAQICLNGHVITPKAKSHPQSRMNFCDKCGEPTIIQCAHCREGIRGSHRSSSSRGYLRPSFCLYCGTPFPWMERALKAAQDLVDERDNLTEEERDVLKRDLDDIVRDTPQTPVAVDRFKRLIPKAGKEAAEGIKNILINVVTEAVKKSIWP